MWITYSLLQAFWLLDHEDYDEAVNMLLDPLISGNDIEAWQHRAVLVSLLAQGHPKLALKYSRIRRPPQKDLADIQVTRNMMIVPKATKMLIPRAAKTIIP